MLGGIETALLIVASLISLFVGATVYSKNPKSTTHIVFGLLSLSLIFWSITNYFSLRVSSDSASLSVIELIFVGVVLQNSLFYLFATVFPAVRPPKYSNIKMLFVIYSASVVALIASNKVITGFENGNIVVGPAIALFALHALLSVGGGFYCLLKDRKKAGSQKKYLIYGSLVLWVIVPITNFVLPSVFDINIFVRFSSLFVLIFNLIIAFAIMRYRLFDLRAVVARASGYILTTFFVVVGTVSLAYLTRAVLFSEFQIEASQLIPNIILTAVLVLTFPLFKHNFDRLTNRIFYRDAYDAQALVDQLNQTLVSNIELESLLTKSALVLQESLKIEFCTFYIRETSYFDSRVIGAHRKDPEIEQIEELEIFASKLHHRVHSSEREPASESEEQLTKVLKKSDIEVLARLVTTLEYDVKGIGYILLGRKKNGSQYTPQDLKILEIVANELVIAIENALRYEEIEQFNVTLQKKIDDATKELKVSNEKLRALDEAKDEFVSMASHQLRTPLTSIKGYISMVLEGDAGKITDVQKQMLGQAFFSSQRMVYLISDLLNVSRLKTGKFIIEPKPVYLPDVVESEISQLQEGATAKNLTLSYVKPKEFPTILLDEMKTRQVIMNFTDNALYYTPTGGKITIELRDKGKSIEFTVKDTGIGVPKNEQHKLFAKFYRAENARKARPDGTGLGLFMAQKVIIAQGGSIIFNSKEGKGSTFGFSFPKASLEVKDTIENDNKQ